MSGNASSRLPSTDMAHSFFETSQAISSVYHRPVCSVRPDASCPPGLTGRMNRASLSRVMSVGLKVRLGDIVIDNSIAGQLDALRGDVLQALEERLGDA